MSRESDNLGWLHSTRYLVVILLDRVRLQLDEVLSSMHDCYHVGKEGIKAMIDHNAKGGSPEFKAHAYA